VLQQSNISNDPSRHCRHDGGKKKKKKKNQVVIVLKNRVNLLSHNFVKHRLEECAFKGLREVVRIHVNSSTKDNR
jgi:hypothetical protein